MKAAIIILLICTLGLGGALLWRHTQAVKQQNADFKEKVSLTNSIEELRTKLDDQERVNTQLQNNLTQRGQELTTTSNSLVKVMAQLAETQQNAAAAAEAAKVEVAKRDSKITELEGEKDKLDKKAAELQTAIGGLEKSIGDTEKKLAAAEGDREFLLKELKRLQAEKAELERQFYDLSLLRTQIAKLKDEMSIARRLEWIRSGIYGLNTEKGADKLIKTVVTQAPGSKYPLNVELKQDGTAKVVTGSPTNKTVSGTATNTPPKPVPAPTK